MSDDLKARAERAAREYATSPLGFSGRDSFDEKGAADFLAGYLAHAKEAEALVEAVEKYAKLINYQPQDALVYALARYRGCAK